MGTVDINLDDPTYIPDVGCPVPLADTRIYTTNLDNSQVPHSIDNITHSSLIHQHMLHSRINGTKKYAISAR